MPDPRVPISVTRGPSGTTIVKDLADGPYEIFKDIDSRRRRPLSGCPSRSE